MRKSLNFGGTTFHFSQRRCTKMLLTFPISKENGSYRIHMQSNCARAKKSHLTVCWCSYGTFRLTFFFLFHCILYIDIATDPGSHIYFFLGLLLSEICVINKLWISSGERNLYLWLLYRT